ncbi:hypothetical protein EMPS_07572 [Entomortierella parvispora]|uniref:Uncharacterized protein n=1 Tax=Entomortierella parvispora TaxID=205924 RepID=A0A9P3HEG3_9FUNG|nr:hypothetical protein EMPS_07572 [Entomortierella parvispora]
MTTFHDQITSFPVSSFDTTSTFDLFHFPENDFKDAHRQRSQRIQKSRERSTVNYLIRRSTAASSEDQTIQRKKELRLKNGSNSNSSSDEFEQDLGDKRRKDKKNHNNNKQQGTTQLSQLVDVDRSNKRADRRNKLSEEEILQLQQHKHQQQDDQDSDEDTGYSSGSSSSSSSSVYRGRGGRHHGKSQILEVEERIRFKHNLAFAKGNSDDGTMATKRIDAQSFQKVFEKKLDEKDEIRSSKHTSRR